MSGILGIHYSNSSDEEEEKASEEQEDKGSSGEEAAEENKVFSSDKEEESSNEEDDEKRGEEKGEKENVSHRHDFSETVATEWVKEIMATEEGEEVKPPARATGACDPKVADTYRFQIEKFRGMGQTFNENLQQRKDFRNPSIYEKLIKICNINERGTNYPKKVYDPGYWYNQPTYQDLARMQRDHYKKLKEKSAKEAAAKSAQGAGKPSSRPGSKEPVAVKKSKWDAKPKDMVKQAQLNSQAKYPFTVVSSASTSSTTKSIPANGSLFSKDK